MGNLPAPVTWLTADATEETFDVAVDTIFEMAAVRDEIAFFKSEALCRTFSMPL